MILSDPHHCGGHWNCVSEMFSLLLEVIDDEILGVYPSGVRSKEYERIAVVYAMCFVRAAVYTKIIHTCLIASWLVQACLLDVPFV